MNPQIMAIAQRIRELREILEVPAEELAEKLKLGVEEYLSYENGEGDIPIGVIYGVAAELNVDPTVLLTGSDPHMSAYTIVRKGHGVSIERYQGYSFSSLAFNYINRDMEPMLVMISPKEKAELVTHGGQEFNYVLEGKVKVIIGSREFILNEGDSIYFDPSVPHGQRAEGGAAKFLTVINE